MEPLDLERQAPRSPRDTLFGCCFLPRTIDKLRAELPGGKPGGYIVTGSNSISAYVLHKLRIDVDELRAAVAAAPDEAAVVAWLRARVDPVVGAEITGKLASARVDTLPPAVRAQVEALHPVLAARPEIVSTFEMLEADDAALSAP